MATGGGGTPQGENEEPSRLTCAVCLEKYRRPKLLPCFHTFCQSCVQDVAGTSPSFPCPACRAIVLLPPGGVPALQTNFYIEQNEEGVKSSPPTKLCDVCPQDQEATQSCVQCQQNYCVPCGKIHGSITSSRAHTVVPVQPGDPGNEGRQGRPEELCPSHTSQAVVLRCVPCQANICLQCKTAAHVGHTTEDLQVMGKKVMVRLQERLQTLSHQTSALQGVLVAVGDRRERLADLLTTTEQGIRERVTKAHQLVDECQENTLGSLKTVNQGLLESLSATEEGLQHRHAALRAQTEHITRVLRKNKDTDIVDLETQLNEVAFDQEQVVQMLNSLESESDPYSCEHNPLAIGTAQLQEFVGVLKKSAAKNTDTDSEPVMSTLGTTSTPALALHGAVSMSAPQSGNVLEMVYSRNRSSRVAAVCTTSEDRVWIKYKPSGEGDVMALFGKQGLEKSIDESFGRHAFVTVLTDTTIGFEFGNKFHWVSTDGTTGKGSMKLGYINSTAKTSRKQCVYAVVGGGIEFSECCQFHVTSLDTAKWKKTEVHSEGDMGPLKDVSRCERYFVFSKGSSAHLYLKSSSEGLRRISTYCPAPDQRILDACFFPVGGREMMLVVVEGDHKVHVVDHTDGCCFVQYLDTRHVTLHNPRCLATDQETVLWVACNGGQLIMMEI